MFGNCTKQEFEKLLKAVVNEPLESSQLVSEDLNLQKKFFRQSLGKSLLNKVKNLVLNQWGGTIKEFLGCDFAY